MLRENGPNAVTTGSLDSANSLAGVQAPCTVASLQEETGHFVLRLSNGTDVRHQEPLAILGNDGLSQRVAWCAPPTRVRKSRVGVPASMVSAIG